MNEKRTKPWQVSLCRDSRWAGIALSPLHCFQVFLQGRGQSPTASYSAGGRGSKSGLLEPCSVQKGSRPKIPCTVQPELTLLPPSRHILWAQSSHRGDQHNAEQQTLSSPGALSSPGWISGPFYPRVMEAIIGGLKTSTQTQPFLLLSLALFNDIIILLVRVHLTILCIFNLTAFGGQPGTSRKHNK